MKGPVAPETLIDVGLAVHWSSAQPVLVPNRQQPKPNPAPHTPSAAQIASFWQPMVGFRSQAPQKVWEGLVTPPAGLLAGTESTVVPVLRSRGKRAICGVPPIVGGQAMSCEPRCRHGSPTRGPPSH